MTTTTNTRLTPDQTIALRWIGRTRPAALVEVRRWTAAASLVRRGLVAKLPTTAKLTAPPDWYGRRELALPRAAYSLTPAGIDALRAVGFYSHPGPAARYEFTHTVDGTPWETADDPNQCDFDEFVSCNEFDDETPEVAEVALLGVGEHFDFCGSGCRVTRVR